MLLKIAVTGSLYAQPYNFTNYTHKDQITDMAVADNLLWMSTTGGIVRYAPESDEVEAFINTDGLRTNDINFVTPASGGDIYFGSSDGVLIRRNAFGFEIWQLQGNQGTRLSLNAADTAGNNLWIASSAGVIKFDRFRFGGEVRETYRTLGSFESESDVVDVVIFGDLVYAATDAGLAYAEHQNEFLLDPAEWSNNPIFANGLDASSITKLAVFNDQLFVGTDVGLFRMSSEGAFELQQTIGENTILDLYTDGSELYVVLQRGISREIWEYSAGQQVSLEISDNIRAEMTQVVPGTSLFFGTEESGAYRVDGNSASKIEVDGPSSNDLVGGGLTSSGEIFAVSRFADVSLRRSDGWEKIALTPREKLHGIVTAEDELWVATFGAGAYRVNLAGEVEHYTYDNSPLIGIAQDPTVSVVNNLHEDANGNIWYSLFQAAPFRPMVMFDPSDSMWTWWDAADGLVSGNNEVIAAGLSTAAIGVNDQGVAFLRYGADPFDHTDDIIGYFDRRQLLPANIVTALAYDRDDLLWVGTSQGLAYFDSDIDFFFSQALPPEVTALVTAIAVDNRNNLWIGTMSGLALVPSAGALSRAFTSQNSDLISDQIEALSYDDESNQLLIFTRNGLSILDLEVGSAGQSDAVYAYPNPFRIRLGEENRVAFNLDQRGDVRIYTVAGDLVNSTTVNAGWDGRNESGELVASGIYIFHILAEDGSDHTGKIFVIRR